MPVVHRVFHSAFDQITDDGNELDVSFSKALDSG